MGGIDPAGRAAGSAPACTGGTGTTLCAGASVIAAAVRLAGGAGFEAGAFEAGAFEAGAFEAGAFEAGAFEAGAFRAGAFPAGGGALRTNPPGGRAVASSSSGRTWTDSAPSRPSPMSDVTASAATAFSEAAFSGAAFSVATGAGAPDSGSAPAVEAASGTAPADRAAPLSPRLPVARFAAGALTGFGWGSLFPGSRQASSDASLLRAVSSPAARSSSQSAVWRRPRSGNVNVTCHPPSGCW